MSQAPQIGERVSLWARPQENVLLNFGSGRLEKYTHLNGQNCPVVLLDSNEEVVLYFTNVFYGAEQAIQKSCEDFIKKKGNLVLNWKINDFIKGKTPDPAQIASDPTVKGSLPEPKTGMDRFQRIVMEIENEELLIKGLEKNIGERREKIATLRKQILTMKETLLKELAIIEGTAQPETKPTPVPQPSAPTVQPQLPTTEFDNAAARASVED